MVLPRAPALGVGRESSFEFVCEPEVVDDQAARLVPEDPVHPRDRLHQPVAAHRLVDVHGVQTRRVEAGQPHVPHEYDLKGIAGIAEPFRQPLAARSCCGCAAASRADPMRYAGHHDLDSALAVILVMPVRTQASQLAVEVDTDAAAHADDHRLAVHGLDAPVEMRDDVLGDEPEPGPGPGDGLELGPPGLQLLLALDFLALGHFLELGIDLRPLGLVQCQLGESALVVDRYGGAVLDGSLDVVDADVIAEHRARVGVLQLDRRAGEADERGIGERIAHVAGVAVDEVVLAPVRLVGDHHDVPALATTRDAGRPFLSGKNFWIVVNTTPPDSTASLARRSARFRA